MIEDFSPQEILKVAVRIEGNGRDFYERMENGAKEPQLKGMWRILKEQEADHQKAFAMILDKAGDYIVEESIGGDYGNYFNAVAGDYIFSADKVSRKMLVGFKTDIDAVDFAITIEKDSILLYSALKDRMKPGKQKIVEAVINEERKHLSALVDVRRDMGGK